MRLLWLPDVLSDAGLDVVETPGWQARGKDGMRPLVVVGHHTGSQPRRFAPLGDSGASDMRGMDILINGRPPSDPKPLPGPLCHLGLVRGGAYFIVAAGKANHAGAGQWDGANESVEAIGIEAFNWGASIPFPTRELWSPVQLDAYDRGVAALLAHIGQDASHFCGHREWATPPGRKPDPSGIDLDAMRARVAAIMEPMTPTQARIEVATAWHAASGEWMTPLPTETRQQRLTRLAAEVTAGGRTAAQIATHAVRTSPPQVGETVPAWVLDPSIPA